MGVITSGAVVAIVSQTLRAPVDTEPHSPLRPVPTARALREFIHGLPPRIICLVWGRQPAAHLTKWGISGILVAGPGREALFLSCFPAPWEQILPKHAPLVPMGTSNPHLVRNLPRPGAADPGRILVAGGVLIDREAVDLIGCQGFHLPWADDHYHTIMRR